MPRMSNDHTSFWKSSGKVPGRPSPKRENKHSQSSRGQLGSASFQDFQQSVSDAWDAGDDEFCIISNNASSDAVQRKKSSNSTLAPDVVEIHKNHTVSGQHGRHNNLSRCTSSNEENSNLSNVNQNIVAPESMQNLKLTENRNNIAYNNRSVDHPFGKLCNYPGRPQLQKKFAPNFSKSAECESRIEKFKALLEEPMLNMIALRELSWSGIPSKMRAVTWRLLSGHLPTSLERRQPVLDRKRLDYHNLVEQYFNVEFKDESQQDTYRQIHIDVPRMNPQIELFQQKLVQEMFERILFIWAIRHPASGYVQGINDLVTPFFIVFLQEQMESDGRDFGTFKIDTLKKEQRDIIEADSFWCLSKFLDCIQDNYIFAQLGIQAKVNQLKELMNRIDGVLHSHLQKHGVDYLQFSFRWMNNLLTRELPLHCTIRLWDTYLAESDGFAIFQLYVCAAFLLYWRTPLLQEKDFQGLMIQLQNLPTNSWSDSHISMLVAEAFRLKFTYADAPKHLADART